LLNDAIGARCSGGKYYSDFCFGGHEIRSLLHFFVVVIEMLNMSSADFRRIFDVIGWEFLL
jgi:hypothetical protein